MSLISGVALGSSQSNSGSWTGITVPAGTKLAVLGVDGYIAVTAYFTSPDAMPTLGSLSMTCPDTGHVQDQTTYHMGGTFYLINPTVGSGQTLAWDWAGAADLSQSDLCVFYLAFFDDVVTGVRASSGNQLISTSHSTGAIAAQSGDLVVACASLWGSLLSITWTNATEISTQHSYDSNVSLAYAYASGSITISAESANTDGGIFGVAFIPSAGATLIPRMGLLGVG